MTATAVASCPCIPDEVFCAWSGCINKLNWTVMKPIGLFKTGGRVPKSFFFEKPNETIYFFRSAFQSTLNALVKFFFVLGNADFFKLKNASELSWGKVLLIRVLYRAPMMSHGWSVSFTKPTAIGFTAFLLFLTDMRCCKNSKCGSKNGNLEQLWISV